MATEWSWVENFLRVLEKKKAFLIRTKIFLQTGIKISMQLKLRHAAGARARAFLDFKYVVYLLVNYGLSTF